VSRFWNRFFKEDQGQDLAEYCLITALVVLVAVGILWHISGGLQGIWGNANASIAATNATTTENPAVH